eukprot:CAMPEP_0119265100 /NCGR_PEP_ID=MMETSP1329-20130426/4007_1 /TAXON_ID=114041 /ORGANISM="Genus nov. species nov., Strain RCC1024" /LENGTH=60 /DNA_ID=CAMNT_0007264909 /DNA_START=1 /DNA_END=183 /DNA_ORIENTATION=-
MKNFGLHLPLPATWDTDDLKLTPNNDFATAPKVSDSTEHLKEKLHNLEQRVAYLERRLGR